MMARNPTRRTHLQPDPLADLEVITRLEVGPVRLEQHRLVAPYVVLQNGTRESFDLIYRYEEGVFDPADPASVNLAGMVAAQVALNYGLFCKEIAFRGLYDRHDRQFLDDMARNTAREIFVKKFLEPNPFLIGRVTQLPPVQSENYLRATLTFSSEPGPDRDPDVGPAAPDWADDPSRHAVLSSGGKDSLLSFGLLHEIGRETHPIFVNESGRHWYTALNAYRHFKAQGPETGRVWTNADRLFTWMLRRLPFVRKDFAKFRSDDYPIRLWTVAVFVFAALPLMRKRGIGRLVIGNEFDTTRRLSYQGITHYDGLYDQSRAFDNALTRYYHRKGWKVSQFSILRPLSELLIQKVLSERYPDLQHNQVSCHAAHIKGGRVYPCGQCEKCRRIVGMLTALGIDPEHCGYTRQQVKRCLKMLAGTTLHQEVEGAQHLTYLLLQKGIIATKAEGPTQPRPRPEVLKLRFGPERSPAESIPIDLRQPLYGIWLQHSQGAVKRIGRIWVDTNALTDVDLARPYPFESPAGRSGSAKHSLSRAGTYLLGEFTWPEAQARLKQVDIALLPVGSIEQHGPHLPLDTDAFDADHLARQVAAACSDPKPIVLPLIPYGVSYHHADFSGTISLNPETLTRIVYEVGMSVARHGVTKLVIINGHGGNAPALHFAAQMINRDAHIFTCVDTGETSDADITAITHTADDLHAGEIETSTTLAVRPHLVHLDQARKFVPRFSSRYLNLSSKRSVEWYTHTAKISPSGVLGDPTKASREKGEQIWELMIRHLVQFVEDLKRMSLDDIHQRPR